MSLMQEAMLSMAKKLNSSNPEAPESTESVESVKEVTPEMRKGWEAYRKHLEDIGMYGNKRLNTNYGIEVFDKWSKKNPQYGLNLKNLPEIGQELKSERERYINAAQKDKSIETYIDDKKVPATEYNKSDIANSKTANPWHPGVEFTSQGFMEQEVGVQDEKGKEIGVVKLGQVTPQVGILTPGMKQKAAQEILKKIKKP
jgi:hypothetical protein